MSTINSVPLHRSPLHLKPQPVEAEQQQLDNKPVADPILSYGDLLLLNDDMSAVMAQFRRRADAEKRAASATDPFERILEEESEPKVDKLTVIARSTEISKQDFLGFARSLFPDDSDIVMVLRELIKRRKAGAVSTVDFEELLEEVWEQSNPKLCQAGLNVGLKARLFSRKMDVSPKALRNSYREFLVNDDGELFQYEQWVDLYGANRRGMVTEFIETSLLHDIQSHDPSCSRPEFGALLGHVVILKKLKASDVGFLQVFYRANANLMLLEPQLLKWWFDCLQRPFTIKKEIEKNFLNNLSSSIFMSAEDARQKLLMGIRQLDGDLFLDSEIKQILIESLLNFDPSKITK
jgi:type III secretion system YopN/LcrE/InvE/MxiC family regulator